jgi:UDP-N-acetylmuramate--alanine ligase
MLLGVTPEAAAQAASTFLGASRRFQVRGEENGVTVVDDYAHHPTEISALLDAARRRYPRSVIRVLFQPHLFSRTRTFAHEFAEALSKADDVIVTGIFPARELQRDFPDVSAMTIVDAAQDVPHASAQGDGTWISAVDDMQVAAQMLAMRCRPTDVVFTVGAGDITVMGAVILHALGARHNLGDR